jgi:hypothetical protein
MILLMRVTDLDLCYRGWFKVNNLLEKKENSLK